MKLKQLSKLNWELDAKLLPQTKQTRKSCMELSRVAKYSKILRDFVHIL